MFVDRFKINAYAVVDHHRWRSFIQHSPAKDRTVSGQNNTCHRTESSWVTTLESTWFTYFNELAHPTCYNISSPLKLIRWCQKQESMRMCLLLGLVGWFRSMNCPGNIRLLKDGFKHLLVQGHFFLLCKLDIHQGDTPCYFLWASHRSIHSVLANAPQYDGIVRMRLVGITILHTCVLWLSKNPK